MEADSNTPEDSSILGSAPSEQESKIEVGASPRDTGSQPVPPASHSMDRRTFIKGGVTLAAAAGLGARLPDLGNAAIRFRSAKISKDPLVLWQFYSGPGQPPPATKWFRNLVADWNKSHKQQVRSVYIPSNSYLAGPNLFAAFAAGHGPDIFFMSPGDFAQYANADTLVELGEYMTPEARSDFISGIMSSRMINGKIYALPLEDEPMAFFYSVKAFEDAHLSEADIPKTWTQLLDVARKLTTKKRFGVEFATDPSAYQNFTWYPYLWETGTYVVEKNGKNSGMAKPGAVAALELWKEAVASGVAPRKAGGGGAWDVMGGLVAGYTAMQNVGIWAIGSLVTTKNFPYGVFRLPTPTHGVHSGAVGGWAFVANKHGANPDAAAQFCVWAIGSMEPDSIQRSLTWSRDVEHELPTRHSTLKLLDREGYFTGPMKFFRDEAFPGSRGEPRFPPEIRLAVTNAIQAAQLGTASAAQAGETAAQAIENYLPSYFGIPMSDQSEAYVSGLSKRGK